MNIPEGFKREDLECVAESLFAGYPKTINVGNVNGEGDMVVESTTAYASRFIQAALNADLPQRCEHKVKTGSWDSEKQEYESWECADCKEPLPDPTKIAPTPPAQEPEFSDGCDHEGFPGGCERFGHTVETCPDRLAQDDEPFGYLYGTDAGEFFSHRKWVETDPGETETKLYTRPDTSELRMVAEEAAIALSVCALSSSMTDEDKELAKEAFFKLCAALKVKV